MTPTTILSAIALCAGLILAYSGARDVLDSRRWRYVDPVGVACLVGGLALIGLAVWGLV